jgi:hypothetical protein
VYSSHLRAIAPVAVSPTGKFRLLIDEVEVR